MFSVIRGSGVPRVAPHRSSKASTAWWQSGALRRALARAVLPLCAAVALSGSPRAAAAAPAQHVVSRGQTLIAIARRYRTTVDALLEVNGLRRGQHIHPGLVLVIPEKGKEAEAAKKAAELREAGGRPRSGGKKGAREANSRKRGDDAARGKGKADGVGKGKGDRGKKGSSKKEERGKAGGKAETFARKPKRAGFVHMVRGAATLEVQLVSRGRVVPKALPKLSRLLRASPTAQIAIDPRLAALIGTVSDHFGGRTIRVVSGYRPYSPKQYTPHSNHNVGRAMDFMVEGVPNTVVRDFCRTFRNAGVGYYPNSTFVHLDVRSVKTYWVDYSRPGEAPRYDGARSPVKPDEATRDVPGAVDRAEGGSDETPDSESQPSDTSDVIQRIGDPDPAPAE